VIGVCWDGFALSFSHNIFFICARMLRPLVSHKSVSDGSIADGGHAVLGITIMMLVLWFFTNMWGAAVSLIWTNILQTYDDQVRSKHSQYGGLCCCGTRICVRTTPTDWSSVAVAESMISAVGFAVHEG
jgi:hypothetical protein